MKSMCVKCQPIIITALTYDSLELLCKGKNIRD